MTRYLSVIFCILMLTACVDYLEPGELGTSRFFAEVRGKTPLPITPPISDRDGNVYVLYGNDGNFLSTFIGHTQGTWTSGCDFHKVKEEPIIGWVGTAQHRAWYWSGHSLAELSGKTGTCNVVLDKDPLNSANIFFHGVIPWIRETPSQTTVLALMKTGINPSLVHTVIDLDLGRYTNNRKFEPTDAKNISVLGVGAHRDTERGFFLTQYEQNNKTITAGIALDKDGKEMYRTFISSMPVLSDDETIKAAGYLLSSDGAAVVGLLKTGHLLFYNHHQGTSCIQTASEIIQHSSGLAPIGIHQWDGRLWLVGLLNNQPAISALNPSIEQCSARIETASIWNTSIQARNKLEQGVTVLDQRSAPTEQYRWNPAKTGMGAFPFLHAYSPDKLAIDTTGWIIAGPSFSFDGNNTMTSIAFISIGISYP